MKGGEMVKILVADNDADSHKLVRDILEINFRDVMIDRALDYDNLIKKIKQAKPQYNLILLNLDLQKESNKDIIAEIELINPDLLNSIVILTNQDAEETQSFSKYHIPKPFSLDHFGEVVKKAYSRK